MKDVWIPFLPGIIETVASVSALTFVDLDLDPLELGGRDGPGGNAEKQLASCEDFRDFFMMFIQWIACLHGLQQCGHGSNLYSQGTTDCGSFT